MKFWWLTPFEAGRMLFMKNWKMYSSKTNMLWQLKAVLKHISSPLKSIWPTSVSQNRREVSCSLRFLAFTEENHLQFINSKHFCFYWTKKHFISEWYFTKNHEIGSLAVRKVKNIVRLTAESWSWTSFAWEWKSNCWSFRRHVYRLDE